MRRLALATGVLLLALTPASALGKATIISPPGNAEVNQYSESIPTAGGGRPTSTLTPDGGASRGRSPSAAASTIPRQTLRVLESSGADGHAAAALAEATAPTAPSAARGNRKGLGPSSRHRAPPARRRPAPPPDPATPPGGSSVIRSLVSAVTGGSGAGGVGLLLPVLILATLAGSGVIALLRRQGPE